MTGRRPLKPIVKREYYRHPFTPKGSGSVFLTLECGHMVRRKCSEEPKRQARCLQCSPVEKE